jgi:hypothetical protein
MAVFEGHIGRAVAGLTLAMATLLAGCLPESEHPIAAADPARNDARLWGAWLWVAEDGYTIAHVFATEDGALRIATADHGVEGLGEVETYGAHVTSLPSGDYLNVVVTGSEAGYLIGRYHFEGADGLSVQFASNTALERAVTDGRLAGTTKMERGIVDVRITASPEQWQAFLAQPPADLFDEPISFKRIGPAYVEQQ